MLPHAIHRQDTFDLRDQIHSDDQMHLHAQHAQAHHTDSTYSGGTSDEEHSVLEDDSDIELDENGNPIHGGDGDYIGDGESDISSSLSIPNESIDFDLVYALHSFAMSVEGQASVVKGDSLFLMDDSNSYWWLVRVLKTQEVGYIPAENIETPFERLARLNKHRNVDLAAANDEEVEEDAIIARERLMNPPNPAIPRRGVAFTPALSVHRYPPAIWTRNPDGSPANPNDPADPDLDMMDPEESDGEWDDDPYSDEDPELADEQRRQQSEVARLSRVPNLSMEPDDGMGWELELPGRPNSLGGSGAPVLSTATPKAGPAQLPMMDEPQQMQKTDSSSSDDHRQQPVAPYETSGPGTAPLLPSAIMQQHDEDRKRTREEIEQLEAASRNNKKLKHVSSGSSTTSSSTVKDRSPVSSASLNKATSSPSNTTSNKLRKEQKPEVTTDDESSKESVASKKKKGVFGRLFGSKEKPEKKGLGSMDSGSGDSRNSGDSGRSSSVVHSNEPTQSPMSPTTVAAKKQQARASAELKRRSTDQTQQQQQQLTPPGNTGSPIGGTGLATQLRQRDQQQQALYQQYLNRSPSSPPEQSYGLQSASAVMPPSSYKGDSQTSPTTHRPRPGSLILTASVMEGQGVPELNVIRVFAGQNLQTEATFKTVLLSSSTTSADLVQQAIQRFRLPPDEDPRNYFLTVKQVEGSTAVLRPNEHPLTVFDTLVEAAMELPKVKRSSVGSISSLASNLSMHPAIRKLSMNDFTDDSAVKFYLNRKSDDILDEMDEGDETLMAEDHSRDSSGSLYLNVTNALGVNQDRFSSPSNKFAMQVIIYPGDLPDDMVFDPMTEAIVFKHTLRDRGQSNMTPANGVSQAMRRKIFLFPKNVTVGEVIELGLERFGILEGVVDGGDEVEDKQTKRRSSTRVRYTLAVAGEKERELSPSSKVIDAYQRPPLFRAAERRSIDNKRRSADSSQLLGHLEDLQPDDPTFILRRAVQYRNSYSRHRTSAPLDEIALQRMQRESTSGSSMAGSDVADEHKPRLSKQQELIAAQRAASKANQKALLSAQNNSVRGVDILLPGNTALRSSRYDAGDRVRYSYIQEDGEYDISDIVNEEWQDDDDPHTNDILQGAMHDNNRGLGDKLDRILSKIQDGKASGWVPTRSPSQLADDSKRSTLSSVYSTSTADPRAVTPLANEQATPTATYPSSRHLAQGTLGIDTMRPRAGQINTRQQSFASVMSEGTDGYATPATHVDSPLSPGSPQSAATVKGQTSPPHWDNDDFGFGTMMAIIEARAVSAKPHTPAPAPLHPVDEMLFGRPLDLQSLHPQMRDIYADSFKQLEDMDRALDRVLQQSLRT